MHCQALSLTSHCARRLAKRVARAELDTVTASLAGLYLDALAATLERLEAESAGQLSFLQTTFTAELDGPGPSVAREEPTSRLALAWYSQAQ